MWLEIESWYCANFSAKISRDVMAISPEKAIHLLTLSLLMMFLSSFGRFILINNRHLPGLQKGFTGSFR